MAVNRVWNNTIVILDSNALFIPFKFKLNIDSELTRLFCDYQIIIPSCVLTELRRLENTEKFGKVAFKLALQKSPPEWYLEIESKLFTKPADSIMKYEKYTVDQKILHIAQAINGIVVTNDKEFLDVLRSSGIRTVSLRGRKYLKKNY